MEGKDEKNADHFSTLAKNSVKFFYKRASQVLFCCFLPYCHDLCDNRRDTPIKTQKIAFHSCKLLRVMVYYRRIINL